MFGFQEDYNKVVIVTTANTLPIPVKCRLYRGYKRKRLYECEEKDSTLVIYFYGINSAMVAYGLDV